MMTCIIVSIKRRCMNSHCPLTITTTSLSYHVRKPVATTDIQYIKKKRQVIRPSAFSFDDFLTVHSTATTAISSPSQQSVTTICLIVNLERGEMNSRVSSTAVATISHLQIHNNTLSGRNAIIATRIASTADTQRMAALLQVIERAHELRLHIRHVVRHLPAAAPLILGTPTHQTELEGGQAVIELLVLVQAMLAKRRIARPADAVPAPARHHHVLMLELAKPMATDILLYLIDHRRRSPTGHVDIHDMARICAERRANVNNGEYDCENACNHDRYSHFKQE